jgi:phosphoserine phosphatase
LQLPLKIAFFDLEGTLLKKAVHLDDGKVAPSAWTLIAEHLGPRALEEEIETKNKWNEKKYLGYVDWMRDTVRIHEKYNLDKPFFEKVIDSVEIVDGAEELFSYLSRQNVITCIITGGFKELTKKLVSKFDITHVIAACEYVFEGDRLKHAVYFPSDYFGKVDFMKIIMREYQVTPYECLFVGDGKNDVALAKNVAISFAFNAQDELRAVATETISQESGRENLSEVVRLLKHPTQRMREAVETNVEVTLQGTPKFVTEERCRQLWKEASWVRHSAYAPYSNLRVGAAILSDEDQIFTGCNFENGAYGSTICAERAAVAKMIAAGQRRIRAIAVTSDLLEPIPPCGDCLQVISEFADEPDIFIGGASGLIECHSLDNLLPRRFKSAGKGKT